MNNKLLLIIAITIKIEIYKKKSKLSVEFVLYKTYIRFKRDL